MTYSRGRPWRQRSLPNRKLPKLEREGDRSSNSHCCCCLQNFKLPNLKKNHLGFSQLMQSQKKKKDYLTLQCLPFGSMFIPKHTSTLFHYTLYHNQIINPFSMILVLKKINFWVFALIWKDLIFDVIECALSAWILVFCLLVGGECKQLVVFVWPFFLFFVWWNEPLGCSFFLSSHVALSSYRFKPTPVHQGMWAIDDV